MHPCCNTRLSNARPPLTANMLMLPVLNLRTLFVLGNQAVLRPGARCNPMPLTCVCACYGSAHPTSCQSRTAGKIELGGSFARHVDECKKRYLDFVRDEEERSKDLGCYRICRWQTDFRRYSRLLRNRKPG